MKPTDVKRFHNDLKAAIVAGVPVEFGSAESTAWNNKLTIAELSHFENLVSRHVSDDSTAKNELLSEAIESQTELPSRYRAALLVFDRTGSMLPVLDGLTTRRQAQRQVTLILRSTFVYLFVLLLFTWVGLYVFTTKVVPEINEMRAGMFLAAATNPPVRFDVTHLLPLIVTVFGWGMILLLLWMFVGGATRLALLLGGRSYVRCRTSTTVLRTLKMLVAAGTQVDKAITISCDLAGVDAKGRRNIRSAVGNQKDALQIEGLVDFSTILANQRLVHIKTATPIALVSIFGGGITLLYALSIFWPIISMLKDLAIAGT